MTRKHLYALILVAATAMSAKAVDFPYESCTYSIEAHCAFIHETAAHATVSCSCYDNTFNATLSGHSIPIFGTIFCINDTLQAKYIPQGDTVQPAMENVLYQSGYYRKPHEGDFSLGDAPSDYRNIWGQGTLSADASTMECVSLTADMLCMYYYSKTVDFDVMPQEQPQQIAITMPDGTNRTLQVIYHGVTDWEGREAWNLTANFTYGGALSAYPITVLIDRVMKVPVQFVANIDIGEVIMTYEY